jgi:putative ABC transport system permease protein
MSFFGGRFFGRGRRKRERELDEEIAGHLAMATRDRVARGQSPAEAEAAARRELGNEALIKEVTREKWGWPSLERMLQDARYAVRLLRRSPAFTLVAVATLGLGIGANTAIFSVVHGVLLRPLPFPDSGRIVALEPVITRPVRHAASGSYPDFVDWRSQSKSFEAMASRHGVGFTLTGTAQASHLQAQAVSSDFLSVLRASPLLGRGFLPEDDRPGARVVLLAHALWQSRFGADPGIIGRTIGLDGREHTVIGVMPPGFQFPLDEEPSDLWTSISMDAEGDQPWTANRGLNTLDILGRLKPGASLAAAQAEMNGIARNLARQYPDDNRDRDEIRVRPELERIVGDVRAPLLVLLGAVGGILLIACANVASLLTARASARRRELALRAALGAGRGRVLRQLLTESLILSLLGGGAGILLAAGGMRLLLRFSPERIPRLEQVSLDGTVLAFTFGVSLLTGLLFGAAPALRLARADLWTRLQEGGRGGEGGDGPGSNRFRSGLVVAQTAIAVILLTGAMLLLESFRRLRSVDPGFSAENVTTFHLSLPEPGYDVARQRRFYEELLASIRRRPGVRSAAAIFPVPFGRSRIGISFTIEGRPVAKADEPGAEYRQVSPGYFETLRIPILSGRDFTDRDGPDAPPVVIVNAAFARTFFPGESAVGRRIHPGVARDGESVVREIVGVVGDVRALALDAEAAPEFYVPAAQLSISDMTVVARTEGSPAPLQADARALVTAIDSNVPVYRVRTLEDAIRQSIQQPRFNALLLGLFGGVALLLTGVGLYGVLGYVVAMRTREIVIRMALGARRADILGMIVRRGLGLSLSGVVVGVAAALGVTRLFRSLLFAVAPTDPLAFAAAALALSVVAFAASAVPAWRATRLDPMQALRAE